MFRQLQLQLTKEQFSELCVDTNIQGDSKRWAQCVIQKDGLNFVRLYFLNYKWYVNDLKTFERGGPKFSNSTFSE
jgi:hypothetical protein